MVSVALLNTFIFKQHLLDATCLKALLFTHQRQRFIVIFCYTAKLPSHNKYIYATHVVYNCCVLMPAQVQYKVLGHVNIQYMWPRWVCMLIVV